MLSGAYLQLGTLSLRILDLMVSASVHFSTIVRIAAVTGTCSVNIPVVVIRACRQLTGPELHAYNNFLPTRFLVLKTTRVVSNIERIEYL